MLICKKCGAQLLDESGFCHKCGAPTGINEEPTADETVSETKEIPKKKIQTGKIVIGVIVFLVIAFFLCTIIFLIVDQMRQANETPDKARAKEMAKEEVADAWSEVDEDLELTSITYSSVSAEKMSSSQKEAVIERRSAGGITYRVEDQTYANFGAYLDAIHYEADQNIWYLYTVKGTYRVVDSNCDFDGEYCVTVISARIDGATNWWIESTEIEVPEELRP